jgi:hypothetical protein
MQFPEGWHCLYYMERNTKTKITMTNNNTILVAALGGVIVAGLIAIFTTKKETEPFPLSPANDLNNLRGTASKPNRISSEFITLPIE